MNRGPVHLSGRRRGAWASTFQGERYGFAAMIALAVVSACIQSLIAQRPALRPDFVLLVVVYLALEHGLTTALLLSLAVSYVGDVFSGDGRGLYVSSTMGAFFIVRALAFRFVSRGVAVVASLSVTAALAQLLLMLLIERGLGPGRASLAGLGPALALRLLVAALLAYPFSRLLGRIEARFSPRAEVSMGRRWR